MKLSSLIHSSTIYTFERKSEEKKVILQKPILLSHGLSMRWLQPLENREQSLSVHKLIWIIILFLFIILHPGILMHARRHLKPTWTQDGNPFRRLRWCVHAFIRCVVALRKMNVRGYSKVCLYYLIAAHLLYRIHWISFISKRSSILVGLEKSG